MAFYLCQMPVGDSSPLSHLSPAKLLTYHWMRTPCGDLQSILRRKSCLRSHSTHLLSKLVKQPLHPCKFSKMFLMIRKYTEKCNWIVFLFIIDFSKIIATLCCYFHWRPSKQVLPSGEPDPTPEIRSFEDLSDCTIENLRSQLMNCQLMTALV